MIIPSIVSLSVNKPFNIGDVKITIQLDGKVLAEQIIKSLPSYLRNGGSC